MKITVESTLLHNAEWRRSGRGDEGCLYVALAEIHHVELRIRMDDPMRGCDLARQMRRGAHVVATGHRAWPRTDHSDVAVLVGDITELTVNGARLM
jgi:hypothetical protein